VRVLRARVCVRVRACTRVSVRGGVRVCALILICLIGIRVRVYIRICNWAAVDLSQTEREERRHSPIPSLCAGRQHL
jgi:hypothetical protein